jgi:hypothetical protein
LTGQRPFVPAREDQLESQLLLQKDLFLKVAVMHYLFVRCLEGVPSTFLKQQHAARLQQFVDLIVDLECEALLTY